MSITIRAVKLTRAGFAISYHPRGTPSDVRATLLDPERMPAGHELLRAGAQVDVELVDGRIAHVREAHMPTPRRVSAA